MRTLNRPMFNMGGPIKQGIMHGIREPYRGGGAALVGNPVYPQTGGREHHNVWLTAGNVAGRGIRAFKNIFGSTGPVTRTVPKQGPPLNIPTGRTLSSKGYPGGQIPGKTIGPGTTEVTEQIFKPHPWAAKTGKYLEGTPEWAAAKGIYQGKGLITKPIKYALKSPLLTGAGLIWAGDKWVWGDGTPASDAELAKLTSGQHGPFDHTDKKKIKKAQDAFAEAQRDTRVKKYLDMMGYDRSKKTAVADALIDASKIVSERGSLKGDVTRELINPIIQATSKRFDKPEQIREAVGLMMVKGEIEKEMYEAKPGTILKNVQDMIKSGIPKDEAWAIATKESKGVVADLQGAIATGKMSLADWPAFVRATGAQHGEEVTVITEEEIKANPEKYARFKDKDIMEIVKGSPPGIYIIGGETVRIDAGGKATQLR